MELLSSKVFDLLTYIEEVEKLRRKPTYVVPKEPFAAHAGAIKGLPDIQEHLVEPDGTEVWLRVPRLQEIAPPSLPDALVGWATVSKAPGKLPLLNEHRPVMEGRTQVEELHLADFPQLRTTFDNYVEHLWTPWSDVEKERRGTISLYNGLFSLYQLLAVDGAENPLEIVWGLGMAVWKRPGNTVVEHPLLTQVCELRLNEATYGLDIVPRQADAKLELDCYAEMELPGVLLLEAQWTEMQAKQAASVSPFEPSSLEGIFKAAVAKLDQSGHYLPCEGKYALPPASDKLLISDRWVIYARKRSADVLLEDVRRLKAAIEGGAAIPPVIEAFVTPGDSSVPSRPEVLFRGLSSSASSSGVRELYFPLPYNEEQVSIIRKLEDNDGVAVQGPPGTGKTHTIANVICHYLAQGKRVLVTSKGDTALSVLQQKLPERIRELTVALLADETDGMKQFEHSIGKIASQVASLRIDQLAANIAMLEAQLNELHAQIASVDQAIAAKAAQHMRKYIFQGRELDPGELAKLVLEQTEDHQWFTDTLPADPDEPPLTDEDVARLRTARQHAAHDLSSVYVKLPDPALLPAWDGLLGLHKDIVKARSIEARVHSGAVHALKDSTIETFEAAKQLLTTLTDYVDVHARIARYPVGVQLRDRFRQTQSTDVLVTTLFAVGASLGQLDAGRKAMLAKAVVVPEGAEANDDYTAALERLIHGRSAFSLPFGKVDARELVSATTVEGSAPTNQEQWTLVKTVIEWRRDAKRALARYGTIGVEFGLPAIPPGPLAAGTKQAHDVLELAKLVRGLVFETEQRKLFGAVANVFGTEIGRAAAAAYDTELPGVVESLNAHLEKGRLGNALTQLGGHSAVLDGKDAVVAKHLAQFLAERIGHAAEDEAKLRSDWLALIAELKRLDALREHFQVIADCVHRLKTAGATVWARRIETEPPTQDIDLAIPTLWREAWGWRVAYQMLEHIDEHAQLRARFEKRRELTTKLARVYQELVAERAWLGVCEKSSIGIRQALQGYLTSVKAMGSGTGIRAIRHRKNAREAMTRAHLAVPCWVLPTWRISETLPAELGTFDLVVIDEASQSDIWALPALVRGRKVLVVGDDKQVSPLVVGMPEQKIVDIQNRFLGRQPHGRYMTPDASIYDLASVIFAGNSVMLKEHFRCAPAIIEYSNREFYQGEIRALRVPKIGERLDPPLIDVFVKGGYRKGDKNLPEAEAIVQQIEALIADESMAGRTIGVVTLLGNEQAKLIHDMVNQRIPGEEIIAREINVGPPPVFQGRERHIMLVSMVLQAGNNTAANTIAQQQRFNVALSRARDRIYLFRSVPDGAFPADSLSGKLLRHFRQPFAQDQKAVTTARELCESPFEENVYDALTQRGFRVRPQVPCGGYRIDMVVEGLDGRRLAIECDGDRFHGPGQWGKDMVRQRVLERAGWVFWRCFASSFVRRREEVLTDLWETLAKLKIGPITEAEAGQSASSWVQRIEVEPFKATEAAISPEGGEAAAAGEAIAVEGAPS